MDHSDENSTTPVYNIKAVARMIGLLPVTLRAWERRYGLLRPQRGAQGYRLYSDYDLLTLRWIKKQMDAGMSISRAVEYLGELQNAGKDPIARLTEQPPQEAASTRRFSGQLFDALLKFDELRASEILRQAFLLYTVDQVLIEVIQPVLVRIGEGWHAGEIPIAVEHFCTQFSMQHLLSMLGASAPPSRQGLIVAACAPGETHQIGLLMLVVMLRWRGWDVKYLGPDLHLEGIAAALAPLKPRLLMFTATRPENAAQLISLRRALQDFGENKPLLVLGGQAFKSMRLSADLPAFYLDSSPTAMVGTIEQLLHQS